MNEVLVCTPLLVERLAVGRLGPPARVHRTGLGPRRSARWAAARTGTSGPARAVLVAGVAGGLSAGVRPGDLVVASEVRRGAGGEVLPCGPVPPLVDALRRLGLPVRVGPLLSCPRPVDGAARHELAGTGALAVDMESAWLAPAAAGGPYAVVRAVVDTPDHPLWRIGTPARGVRALRTLRRAAPALAHWAALTGSALFREVS